MFHTFSKNNNITFVISLVLLILWNDNLFPTTTKKNGGSVFVVVMAQQQQQNPILMIPCASRKSSEQLLNNNNGKEEENECNCLEISSTTLSSSGGGSTTGNSNAAFFETAFLSNSPLSSSSSIIVDIFGLDGVFEPLMNVLTWGNHDDYETPILIRNFHWTMVANWNIISSHHPTSLDAFGRKLPYRRCTTTTTTTTTDDDESLMLMQLNQNIAIAYSILYCSKIFFPKAYTYIAQKFTLDYGLDPTICDNNTNNNDDINIINNNNYCDDDISTPWGLAYMIVKEIEILALDDGWNADGSYNRKYNRIPYQDWRSSSQTMYQPNYDKENSWLPLLESNGIGYLTRQEHVTPHIGQTAKSFYMTDDEICSLRAPNPNYDYSVEIPFVLENTANLDNIQKVQVEIFDNKVTLFAPLVSQYYRALAESSSSSTTTETTTTATTIIIPPLDKFEHIQAMYMVVAALYEATVVVWKEKVRYDLIRPTTKVHDVLGGDVIVRSYAEGMTRDDIPADNWEPFVRTMPHSEYPSGSSCLCTAAAVALNQLLGDGDGDDKLFVNTIGTPLTMQKIENSVVDSNDPSTNYVDYGSWTEIETICGQSRLWGGMHFSSAVPAGHDLCHPIGIKISEVITDLTSGIVPEFVMDVASVFNNNDNNEGEQQQQQKQEHPVKEIRCPNDFDIDSNREESTDDDGSSESSSSSSLARETPQLLFLSLVSTTLIAFWLCQGQ